MKQKLNIDSFTISYDQYDENSESKSFGVTETFNLKTLSYDIFFNGKLKETRQIDKMEAMQRFDYISESFKNKL